MISSTSFGDGCSVCFCEFDDPVCRFEISASSLIKESNKVGLSFWSILDSILANVLLMVSNFSCTSLNDLLNLRLSLPSWPKVEWLRFF